jgi:hypothetical protein
MENFERLSNEVLIRTCPCGIVFKTYDSKKVYHSNSCRASYVREKIWSHDSPKKGTKAKEANPSHSKILNLHSVERRTE